MAMQDLEWHAIANVDTEGLDVADMWGDWYNILNQIWTEEEK